jgi:ribosome-binding protein aMBF1 (putative translation factor)
VSGYSGLSDFSEQVDEYAGECASMEYAETLMTASVKNAKTTDSLAREINVSPKKINDLRTGRTPHDLDAVKRCAEFLGVSIRFLHYREDDRRN